MLISSFVANTSSVKEKDFGNMQNKVNKTKQDLLMTSLAQGPMLQPLEDLNDVLSSCRGMVRPLSNYFKSQRSSHLEKLLPCLSKLFQYCGSTGLTVPPELLHVHLLLGSIQHILQHNCTGAHKDTHRHAQTR